MANYLIFENCHKNSIIHIHQASAKNRQGPKKSMILEYPVEFSIPLLKKELKKIKPAGFEPPD